MQPRRCALWILLCDHLRVGRKDDVYYMMFL